MGVEVRMLLRDMVKKLCTHINNVRQQLDLLGTFVSMCFSEEGPIYSGQPEH